MSYLQVQSFMKLIGPYTHVVCIFSLVLPASYMYMITMCQRSTSPALYSRVLKLSFGNELDNSGYHAEVSAHACIGVIDNTTHNLAFLPYK